MNESSMFTEVLIMRNTVCNRLYDVVKVNYFSEEANFIVKGLEFEEAVAAQLEIEDSFN